MEPKNQNQVPEKAPTQVPTEAEFPMVEVGNIRVEDGRLRSITIKTNHLLFLYSYYEGDRSVSLEIARKFNDDHRLTIDAFISPQAAEELMVALFSTKYLTNGKVLDETREKWKHIFGIVQSLVSNVAKIGTLRIWDDATRTVVTVGYERKGEKFYIFAEAEWKDVGSHTCYAHEADLVAKEEVNRLSTYLETVLTLIGICK